MTCHKALIVVDVQNDFCDDVSNATLPVSAGGRVARSVAHLLASSAVDAYDLVVFSQDWHVNPGTHFATEPDYIDSWPSHCVASTNGAKFHRDLAPEVARLFTDPTSRPSIIVRKGQNAAAYSVFEGVVALCNTASSTEPSSLTAALRAFSIDAVDVCGLALDYCVQATALDAMREGFDTTLLKDLTASVHASNTHQVYEELRNKGIIVR